MRLKTPSKSKNTFKRRKLMKNFLTKAALTLALALSLGAPAALAKNKKRNPERVAAIKNCNAGYKAALKEAKTKKGNERREAEAKARADRKQCIADAPK
jgi:hypothetical protein